MAPVSMPSGTLQVAAKRKEMEYKYMSNISDIVYILYSIKYTNCFEFQKKKLHIS